MPTNVVARLGGFREREYFRIEDERIACRWPSACREPAGADSREPSSHGVVLLGFVLLIAVFGAAVYFAFDRGSAS